MTDIQPPLNRPSPAQMEEWADWTEKELLVASVVRMNAVAALMMQVSQQVPEVMGSPMMKMAMKFVLKSDKT